MLEPQSGVPIPKPKRTRPGKYPFATMEIGEFFFVPNRDENNLISHASTAGRKLGRKFKTRHLWARESLEGWVLCSETAPGAIHGVGIWRLK